MRSIKVAELDKATIRRQAITELTLKGNTVWINNNIAIPGRKFIGRKGVSDLVGITRTGHWCACEVKTINDKLSDEQIDFLTEIKQRGGTALLAQQNKNGKVELVEF
jgi:hypothetical protein